MCESVVVSLILCCSLRSQGGVCSAAWACGSGGRAWEGYAAVPRDLYNGAAASCHRLPRPGGSESCVSQFAGRSTRQSPQRCLALWPGQIDCLLFFVLLLDCLPSLSLSSFSQLWLWGKWLTPSLVLSGRSQNHSVWLPQHPQPNRPLLYRFVIPPFLFLAHLTLLDIVHVWHLEKKKWERSVCCVP